MTAVSLSMLGGAGWQFLDNSGDILSGGRLYTYEAGSTTPVATYTDYTGNTSNGVYVQLDSAGRPSSEVWLLNSQPFYKFEVKSSAGASIRTYDYIPGIATQADISAVTTDLEAQIAALQILLAGSTGAAQIGFRQSGTAPLAATVQSKERQILNAADFSGFDATGVTASTTAISNAITEASVRGRTDVMIPTGAKTGALTLPPGVFLVGPNGKAQLTADTGTYSTITLSGSDCGVKNLEITETAKSGGATFTIACGTTGKDRLTIDNIITWSSYQLIDDSGSGSGAHTTTKLKAIQAKSHRGPGVVFTRQFAFGELDDVVIDYVGVSASDYTGFSFDGSALGAGSGGLILERCDVLGTAGVFTNANQIGYNFTSMSAVRIRNSRADTCCSDGWRFNTINGLIMDDVTAGICDGHGMVFTSVTSAVANKLFLFGRNYLTTPSANKDGMRFVTGNAGCIFGTVLARDFTGHGIDKTAAQTGVINIAGYSGFNNTGRAVKTAGDSGFLVTGGQFQGNTAGNYDLGGAYDYIMSSQLNSGSVVTSVGPGPATG